MWRMPARTLGVLMSVLLLLGPAACRSEGEGPPVPPSSAGPRVSEDEIAAGIEWQRQLIAKGTVGKTEFESAAARVQACLTPFQVEVRNEGWDPVEQQKILLLFRNLAMDQDTLGWLTDQCQIAYLEQVADAYKRGRPPRMTTKLHAAVVECLRRRDIAVDNAPIDPFAFQQALPEAQWHTLSSCVDESAKELYPNLSLVKFP